MAVLYTNNAASTISASISNVGTSLSVAAGTGSLFPSITGGDYFYATLSDASGNLEIIKVTARSTDTFTVVRAQEGTTARSWASGDRIELRITKAMLDDFKADTRAGYAPLTGTGTSGTWPISITGSAATATDSTKLPLTGGALTGNVSLDTADGEILVTPTGWRTSARAAIKVRSKTDSPAEIDLRHTVAGVESGWHFSARAAAGASELHFYRFNMTSAGAADAAGSFVKMFTFKADGAFDALGAITQNSSQVLHAGNYNSYSPTLTGTGASGTWGISISGNASSANTASGVGSFDNRTIAPASYPNGSLYAGFTSWANNNTAPYADYLHLNSYSDSSGGQPNLVTFRKDAFGMRIWRQTFGSGTAYSSYVDMLHSSNYSNYALPLSGGTLTGTVQINTTSSGSSSSHVIIKRSGASAPASFGGYAGSWRSGLEIWNNDSTRMLFLNPPESDSLYANIKSVGGGFFIDVGGSGATRAIQIESSGSANFPVGLAQGGNAVLTTGNYSSYALPLSGGTVSGNLGLGVAPDIRLSVNGEAHISSFLYMGGTAGSKNTWGSRDYTSGSSRYVNANYFEVNNYGYGSNWTFAVDGSSSRYNGNVILHAGNYSSYAVPLSGGTMTGDLVLSSSWGSGSYNEQLIIYGTYPSMTFRSTTSDTGWLFHTDSGGSWTLYSIAGATTNNWTQRYTFNTDGTFRNGGPSGSVYLHAGNYNSYSPTLTGGGASGTWSINVTGNSGTVGGLSVHSDRNNEANKVVRTDGNGYMQAGWINTTSGDSGSGNRIDRVYCSYDGYVRYLGLTNFKMQMGLSAKNNYQRYVDYTSDSNYWVGSMGGSGYGANETFHGGSGFFDIWSGTNYPSGTSHIHGFNALHYTANSLGSTGGNAYGIQVAGQYNQGGELWSRGCSGGTFSSWRLQLDSSNYSNYALPLSGGTVTGNFTINNTSPTIYLRDTDGRSSMVHANGSYWLVLRGDGNNSTSWATYNGWWPLRIYMENNDALFGGNLEAIYNVTAYSDERLKKNWRSMPDRFIERLAQVRNGIYERVCQGEEAEVTQVGVSAQSLRELLPEAVLEAKDEMKTLSVAYGNAALSAAVELAKEIVKIREEIELLKAKLC